MKNSLLRFSKNKHLVIALSLLTLVLASSCRAERPPQHNRGVDKKSYQGIGIVESFDSHKGIVQIKHEEIKGYMEAMSMSFRVREKSLLSSINNGDQVEFTLEDTAGIVVLTELRKR